MGQADIATRHSQKVRPWSLDRQTFTLGEESFRAEMRRGLQDDSFEVPFRELLPILTPYRRVPAAPLVACGLFCILSGACAFWALRADGGAPAIAAGTVAALVAAAVLLFRRSLVVQGHTVHRLDTGNWIVRILTGGPRRGDRFLAELRARVRDSQKNPVLYESGPVFTWKRGLLYPRTGTVSFIGDLVRYDYRTPLVQVSFLSPVETFDANVRVHRRFDRLGAGVAIAGGLLAAAALCAWLFGTGGGWVLGTAALPLLAGGGVLIFLRAETGYQFLNGQGDGFAFEIPVRRHSRRERDEAAHLIGVLSGRRHQVRVAREAPIGGRTM